MQKTNQLCVNLGQLGRLLLFWLSVECSIGKEGLGYRISGEDFVCFGKKWCN